MQYYIGLDVSQRQTAICVVDDKGEIVAEGKSLTRPDDIHGWLAALQIEFSSIVRIGLEAGAMSSWLYSELTRLGLPMICLEAFQAHRFLKTCRNKTDRNDARGLAQLVRMGGGFIRPVAVRARASQEDRALLTMRQQLVQQKVGLENNVCPVARSSVAQGRRAVGAPRQRTRPRGSPPGPATARRGDHRPRHGSMPASRSRIADAAR